MNKKAIWILVIIVVVVGIILLNGSKKAPTAPTKETNQPTGENPVATTPATGNIDDAVNSILSEADADAQAPADTNSSLTAPEDFSGLDQSLDTSGIQ